MSLSDRETLELNELCNALVDGTLTGGQRARLDQWLIRSDDAREFYVRAMDQSASLCHHADERQFDGADAPRHDAGWFRPASWQVMGVAAAIVASALIVWNWDAVAPAPSPRPPDASPTEFVARITGTKDASWRGVSASLSPGAFLRRGEQLELAGGFAEITFDSGAVVLLEGPALFDVNSAWDSTLRRGAIKANVPQQAIGFRVTNPAVDVIDVGTEFSMIADDKIGRADVLVLQGQVEAMPQGERDADTVVLRANESRRFAQSGVSRADDLEQLFARFSTPVSLDRQTEPVRSVRWSFDEIEGRTFPAAVVGFQGEAFDMSVTTRTAAARLASHGEGFRNRGLHFSRRVVASAPLAGLSGNSPRTIAFWVRVPENAPLSQAYAMVAWRSDSEKLGSRPVHIGWNRNPNEGPLGAVRTDFSGGHAMGTTPLRDGRWHHIGVIFLPGDDPDAAVQVKQYVDGRLESNTVTPGPKLSIAANISATEEEAPGDTLWLGCRLGRSGPKRERFRGDIDELVIVDRGLEPAEVVALMDGQNISPE
jgi:hypothetical protein